MSGPGATQDSITWAEQKSRVRALCQRDLVVHGLMTPGRWLHQMAASEYAGLPADLHGDGGAVSLLERRVGELLGYEHTLFFSKGVVAQQVALRLWAARHGPRVVLHPMSHLALDEEDALAVLNPVTAIPLGADRPFTADELEKLAVTPSVVSYELPLRRAGFICPSWDELCWVSKWCRTRGVPLHFDAARLWEVAPGLGRSYREIAALADSLYVSTYKGLGAPSGALLAGPQSLIARARHWRTRFGGVAYRNFAPAIAALQGLDTYLPRMPSYHARAVRLAARIAASGVPVAPQPPGCNAFRCLFAAAPELLEAAHLELARETSVWWFNGFRPGTAGVGAYAEVMIGDGADSIADEEIIAAVEWLRQVGRTGMRS